VAENSETGTVTNPKDKAPLHRLLAIHSELPRSSGQADGTAEGAVRVVRLSTPMGGSDTGGTADATRVFHHRWPVRMHKVRQWYPRLGEHRIIWRGPYIKGPAGAPMPASEKVYSAE
jgi:hypothetical protein